MKKRLIILSNTKDPYMNHAVEEILFTTYVDYEQILFLWVNEPTVVFGRNQNPFREIDVSFAQSRGIKLLRRLSGGGTVYHDVGNINYSFIEHASIYDETAHFKIVQEAIKMFGLSLNVSQRKDLSIGGKKVSGSAFYLKGMRRMHHGTLLVDADLDTLWNSLKVNDESFKSRFIGSKSIPSVPSPVVNLRQLNPDINVPDVVNAIVDTYYAENAYNVEHLTMHEVFEAHELAITNLMKKHASWEWVFGETPNFTYKGEDDTLYEFVNGTVKPYSNNTYQGGQLCF
ncbi:MAG TPA: lipoate--protein ligase [Fusibacter sp.]|nr:lipoate--protein ligase [Fusibacter sp.]